MNGSETINGLPNTLLDQPCVIFVSDLHLTLSTKANYIAVEKWLEYLPENVKALYILGDFFDFWIGDDAVKHLKPLRIFMRHLANKAKKIPIFVLAGNRDYLLDHHTFEPLGIHFLTDGAVIDLFGRRTVLWHGDALCRRDYWYKSFRLLVDNYLARISFKLLPYKLRLNIARKVQRLAKRRPRPPLWLDFNYLTAYAQHQQAVQAIFGHIHQAREQDLTGNLRYFALPAAEFYLAHLVYYANHDYAFINLNKDQSIKLSC